MTRGRGLLQGVCTHLHEVGVSLGTLCLGLVAKEVTGGRILRGLGVPGNVSADLTEH